MIEMFNKFNIFPRPVNNIYILFLFIHLCYLVKNYLHIPYKTTNDLSSNKEFRKIRGHPSPEPKLERRSGVWLPCGTLPQKEQQTV